MSAPDVPKPLAGSSLTLGLLSIHLQIAVRNILRHHRRSLLTVTAVAMAVFCLIVFEALMAGLNQKMLESALGMDSGAMQIHAAGFASNQTRPMPLPEPTRIESALQQAGINHFSMRLKAPALILAGRHSSSALLSGIVPEREAGVTFIHQKMVGGSYQMGPGQVLISQGLAKDLGLGLGDSVTLMVQDFFGQPRSGRYTISGLFATGLDSFDQSHIFLSLPSAQGLLNAGEEITEVAASLPTYQAETTVARLQHQLPPSRYQVQGWAELTPDLAQLMALNAATFRLLILILFAIVAMGIANTMTTVIFERFREFGTLTAIGTTPGGIISLVMTESLLLGLFASLAGSVAAMGAYAYLSQHGIDLGHFTSANQYFVAGSVLKAVLIPGDLLAANLLTLATALLAGIYPAWKVARLNPVQALSHV